MRRRLRRGWWRGTVPLLLVAAAFWAANVASAEAGALPTPPPLPTLPTLPIAVPTPTLPPPTLPIPSLPLPTPTIPPLPGAPTPLPGLGAGVTPTPGPAPGASAPASAGSGAAPSSASTSAGLAPGSVGAMVAASDPRLMGQLTAIATAPEAIQPPSLEHIAFLVPGIAGTPSEGSTGAKAGAPAGPRGPSLAPLLLGVSLALTILYVTWRWRGRPGRRALWRVWGRRRRFGVVPSPAAALLLLLAAAMLSAQLVRGASAPAPGAVKAATISVANADIAAADIHSGNDSALHRQAISGARPVQPAVLTTLQRIEQRVISSRQRVLGQQGVIKKKAAVPAPPGAAATAPAVDLTQALAEERAAQAAYQQSLQDEYAYFGGVARDPGQRAALLAGVQELNDPAAAQAVLYDLQVIATYQAQEDAIRAAADALAPGSALVAGQGQALRAPLSAPISQGFGPTSFGLEPPMTYRGVFYPHFHTGIDLVAPNRAPVAAAADGVVILAGQSVNSAGVLVGYGNYVVIQHADGFRTLYGHLDEILVNPGQTVVAGQPVGLEGSSGWSTGPHLHFEVRHQDVPVDPMPFLMGQSAI